METALSTISVMPENKKELIKFQENLINEIINGDDSPLKVLKKLKYIESLVSNVLKNTEIKEVILAEAEKYGEKTFNFIDCQFQIKEVGVKYDYSKCNDSTLNELKSAEKKLKEKIKQRETMLKTMPENIADAQTGEILHRPVKYSTTSVVISLK